MNISDMFGRILGQITSGRWIITIVAAYCLVLLTKTLCLLMEQGKVVLETSTYIAIVMAVLNVVSLVTVFYFQKNRPDVNGDNGNGNTTTTTDTLNTKLTKTTNATNTEPTTTLPLKS